MCGPVAYETKANRCREYGEIRRARQAASDSRRAQFSDNYPVPTATAHALSVHSREPLPMHDVLRVLVDESQIKIRLAVAQLDVDQLLPPASDDQIGDLPRPPLARLRIIGQHPIAQLDLVNRLRRAVRHQHERAGREAVGAAVPCLELAVAQRAADGIEGTVVNSCASAGQAPSSVPVCSLRVYSMCFVRWSDVPWRG